MATNKLSLTQEEQKKLVKYYQSALQDLGNETTKLIKKLTSIAEKKHYKVITDITNATINFYVIELKDIMNKNYNNWLQSDVSMHHIIRGKGVGEDAVSTAKRLENNIAQTIADLFSNNITPINVDGAEPNINPEDLAVIEGHIKEYINKIKDEEIKHISKIDKANEENQLFSCIRGHVLATFSGAIAGYCGRASKVSGMSDDLLNSIKGSVDATNVNNSSMEKSSTATAENVESFPTFPFF